MCEYESGEKPKRSFAEAWLRDDRIKSWIRKVSTDDSFYHCLICNKNISCNTHVLRHANSKCHKNNVKNNLSESSDKKVLNHKFRQQWLDNELFKPWLREVSHDMYSFFCLFCNKSIVGGLSKIYRHAESKIHKNNSEKNNMKENNEDLNTQIDESLLSFDKRKKSAEIRYAALIAEKNIPHNIAKEILELFQEIGKDSNVLKSMSLSRTKCKNIISNVLCPVETKHVVNCIQNTKFSVFIDETSDICNEKWMTFLVRYVEPETLDVRTQLVKLINIDAKDCGAEKLFNAFQSEMYKLEIPFLNILALSCDNASVMTGKHLSFKKKLEEKCKNLLTFACPCHSAALAAHAACAKMPAFCEEFLRKIATFINSSPKRSAIYNEISKCFQDTNRKILKLCDTRWLSHYSCIDRLLESWDIIKYFLSETIVSEKSKSGQYLLSVMENVETKAYLLFLKYVLNFFNSFNAFFQAHQTRIHLLYYKSVTFLKQICKNFLKTELLKDNIQNILFHDKENHKSLNDITLGAECDEYVCELVQEGHADVATIIKQTCLQFYITAAEQIKKRLPVHDAFLHALQVFHSDVALFNNNREASFDYISLIAKTLNGFDENGLKEEWLTLHSDVSTEEKHNLAKLDFDNMWKEILKRKSNNNIKYPHLRSLLNAIRSLPHSNADPERMFSLLSDLKTKKRNKFSSISINASCVLKSGLKARKETALQMTISEQHLSLMTTDKLYNNK